MEENHVGLGPVEILPARDWSVIRSSVMSVIRQDPTTKEWVILATERGKRPHDLQQPMSGKKIPEFEPTCPFCPTNEAMTPPELMRIPHSSLEAWSVRIIPNKFAALQGEGEPARRGHNEFFRESAVIMTDFFATAFGAR